MCKNVYNLNKTEQNNTFDSYETGWLPNGYEITYKMSGSSYHRTVWDYLDNTIVFEQALSGNIHYDTEDVTLQEVIWGDKTITYYQKYDAYLFSWSENSYFFTLTCPYDLPLEDIRRMIESIRPVGLSDGNT